MTRWLLASLLITSVGYATASTKALIGPISDERCEAYTTYREASNQSLEGVKAVLDVLHNRMAAEHKSCLQVVSRKAQFSWNKHKIVMKVDGKWLTRYKQARTMPNVLPSCALWFHNSAIKKPKWARGKRLVKAVGKHRFYC